jgi:hypothetical protein
MAARGSKSKKESAASSTLKPLDEITFFLDRCLGAQVVRQALAACGARVEIHEDHFPPDCEDTRWIPEVGKRGWVILTKDAEVKNNQLELISLLESGAATFILGSKKLNGREMAQAFVRAIPDIRRFLRKFTVPLSHVSLPRAASAFCLRTTG